MSCRLRVSAARSGFTLLEVLLSLAISTMVIAALFMAIDLQLKIASESRQDVEQAQLAHAIMARIADDLRNSVVYRPQDMSGAMSAVSGSSALAGALTGGTGTSGGGSGDGQVTGDTGEEAGGTQSDTPQATDTGDAPPIPGLYGTDIQLQVDISRIPRVDEYIALIEQGTTGTAADLMSDVKTVTYYVLGQTNQTQLQIGVQPGPEDDGQTGLYYRSVDRAATAFAASYGGLQSIEEQGVILSERITSIQFEYFDGTEWLLEWDATDRQGNPVAVRIQMEMYPVDWESMTETQQRNQGAFPMYSTIVWLPASEPTTAGAGSAASSSDDTSSSDDPSTSTGADSSAGGTGSGGSTSGGGSTAGGGSTSGGGSGSRGGGS